VKKKNSEPKLHTFKLKNSKIRDRWLSQFRINASTDEENNIMQKDLTFSSSDLSSNTPGRDFCFSLMGNMISAIEQKSKVYKDGVRRSWKILQIDGKDQPDVAHVIRDAIHGLIEEGKKIVITFKFREKNDPYLAGYIEKMETKKNSDNWESKFYELGDGILHSAHTLNWNAITLTDNPIMDINETNGSNKGFTFAIFQKEEEKILKLTASTKEKQLLWIKYLRMAATWGQYLRMKEEDKNTCMFECDGRNVPGKIMSFNDDGTYDVSLVANNTMNSPEASTKKIYNLYPNEVRPQLPIHSYVWDTMDGQWAKLSAIKINGMHKIIFDEDKDLDLAPKHIKKGRFFIMHYKSEKHKHMVGDEVKPHEISIYYQSLLALNLNPVLYGCKEGLSTWEVVEKDLESEATFDRHQVEKFIENQVVYEGYLWLQKSGGLRRYFFCLQKEVLKFKRQKKNSKWKTIIPLWSIKSIEKYQVSNSTVLQFEIKYQLDIKSNSQSMLLTAQNEEDCKSWIVALENEINLLHHPYRLGDEVTVTLNKKGKGKEMKQADGTIVTILEKQPPDYFILAPSKGGKKITCKISNISNLKNRILNDNNNDHDNEVEDEENESTTTTAATTATTTATTTASTTTATTTTAATTTATSITATSITATATVTTTSESIEKTIEECFWNPNFKGKTDVGIEEFKKQMKDKLNTNEYPPNFVDDVVDKIFLKKKSINIADMVRICKSFGPINTLFEVIRDNMFSKHIPQLKDIFHNVEIKDAADLKDALVATNDQGYFGLCYGDGLGLTLAYTTLTKNTLSVKTLQILYVVKKKKWTMVLRVKKKRT